jgi:hypothetical protein
MQKEGKITTAERVQRSIHSESVWIAAESLQACGNFSNFQSTVEIHHVGSMQLH